MSWNAEQQARLGFEYDLLKRYFPQFQWFDPKGATFVAGPLTTNSGHDYAVKVVLPTNYPESYQSAYITWPRPLPERGTSLRGTSGSMHTLTPGGDGSVQLCLYRSEGWSEANTLYKVILKVRFWLEAYEAHLATGQPIDHYLRHMGS